MKISKKEYKQRVNATQAQLKSHKVEALIVSGEEDIYYLTGLTFKSLERLFLLVIKENEIIFIVPKMELSHLKHLDNVTSIKHYWEYPAQKPERWEDVLFEALGKSSSIGVASKSPFEIAEFLSSGDFKVQKCEIVEQLRWIKSEIEIELIKRAARYCDDTISSLNKNVYYGMTELEVFSIGRTIQQRLIKETDFDYVASDVLVAAWPSRISHQPHGIPKVSDVLIEGSHISLAFLRVNGYAAELERTFFTKEPSKEQAEMYELMMEGRRRCYKTLKAGVSGEEVDLAAKSFFEKEGLKANFVHRTGHGIGLGNHEGPYVAEGDKTILQENMVISIEPGIYIEGIGGFRHSDTVRVTKDGYEILTNCPDDLKSMTFTKSKPFQKMKGMIIKKMYGIR
jgi:Xaa-Pro dipeptidase